MKGGLPVNNLIFWLKKEDYEKLMLLRALDAHTQSLKQLSQVIEHSLTTTLNRITALQAELANANLPTTLTVTNTGETTVTATNVMAAVIKLRTDYAKRALSLALITSATFNTAESMTGFCLRNHISKSTFWRAFQVTNDLLNHYDLTLSTNQGIHFDGDEITLRLLVTTLFTHFFGGLAPEFSTAFLQAASHVLDEVADELYPKNDYKRRVFFAILLVISKRRISLKQLINQQFEVPLVPVTTQLAALQSYLKTTPTTDVEAQFIGSLLLAYGPYTSQVASPQPTWLADSSAGRELLALNQALMSDLNNRLMVKLTASDFERLTQATLLVDYRTLLMPNHGALAVLQLSLAPTDQFEQLHFVRRQDLMDAIALPNNPLTDRFNQRFFYLTPALIEATFSSINVAAYYPPIRLMLISTSHSQIQRLFLRVHGLFNRFNLSIASSNTQTVDLILSDASIDTLLSMTYTTTPTFYWHQVPTDEDIRRLQATLYQLTNNKKRPFH